MGKTQKIGILGEELVAKFLMKRGFKIVGRNFRKKWGELDVVAVKKNIFHFVEVKSVSRNVFEFTKYISDVTRCGSVTHETTRQAVSSISNVQKDTYRPEDSIHPMKIARLKRAIQSYLLSGRVSSETEWRFDVASVFIDRENRKARIDFIEDMIL